VLDEAVLRLTGRSPLAIMVSANETAGAPPVSVSRREVLDKARRDPGVRLLFDRFGAVVLDGQPLNPQEE
jgi:hypothetical protein